MINVISIPKGSIKSPTVARAPTRESRISIPKGSIKRTSRRAFVVCSTLFQFQKVRLKGARLAYPVEQHLFQFQKVRLKGVLPRKVQKGVPRISIPKGSIKRLFPHTPP